MSDPTNFNPSQNALSLVLKVKQPVADHAAKLREIACQLTPGGLNNVGTVHFARFLLINDDTTFLVFTEYDGAFEKYINDFINEVGDAFNAILSQVEVPDGIIPVQQHRKEFTDFVRKNDHLTDALYCAYPNLSVLDILQNEPALEE